MNNKVLKNIVKFSLSIMSLTLTFLVSSLTYDKDFFIFSNIHRNVASNTSDFFINLETNDNHLDNWTNISSRYNEKHYQYSTIFKIYDNIGVIGENFDSDFTLIDIAKSSSNNQFTTGGLKIMEGYLSLDVVFSNPNSLIISDSYAKELMSLHSFNSINDVLGLTLEISSNQTEVSEDISSFVVRGFYESSLSGNWLNLKYREIFGEAIFIPRIDDNTLSYDSSYYITLKNDQEKNSLCFDDFIFFRSLWGFSISQTQTDTQMIPILSDYRNLTKFSYRFSNSNYNIIVVFPFLLLTVSQFVFALFEKKTNISIYKRDRMEIISFIGLQILSSAFLIVTWSYQVFDYSLNIFTRESFLLHLFSTVFCCFFFHFYCKHKTIQEI